MSLAGGSKQIKTVTEIAAMKTTLWRRLSEVPNGGGVFPEYPISCQYGVSTFEVDDLGRKIHILAKETEVKEFDLPFEAMYQLYMMPVSVQVDGQTITTVMGELICNQVDVILKNRALSEVLLAHPNSQTVLANETVSLTIRINPKAIAVDYFTIAWYKNDTLIVDAISEELDISVSETATFQAWVTTPYGISKSDVATLTVVTE